MKLGSSNDAMTIKANYSVIISVKFHQIVAASFEMEPVDVLCDEILNLSAFNEFIDGIVICIWLSNGKVLVANVISCPKLSRLNINRPFPIKHTNSVADFSPSERTLGE